MNKTVERFIEAGKNFSEENGLLINWAMCEEPGRPNLRLQ